MSVPATSNCMVRAISCFDWKRLRDLIAEVFPVLSSKEIAGILLEHSRLIGVSEVDGKLAGFYQFEVRFEDRVAWLSYIGVRGGNRSAGIGGRLMGDFEHRARHYGLGTIELDVLVENGAAIRFYERRGYEKVFVHEHNGRNKLRYAKTSTLEPGHGAAVRSPPKPPSSFLEKKYWRLVYLLLVEIPRGFG